MAKNFPIHPKHPERICWGCDKYCSASDLQCGNGSERIAHPCELFGETWYQEGDWQNLLSSQQIQELGITHHTHHSSQCGGKPHIKLPIKSQLK